MGTFDLFSLCTNLFMMAIVLSLIWPLAVNYFLRFKVTQKDALDPAAYYRKILELIKSESLYHEKVRDWSFWENKADGLRSFDRVAQVVEALFWQLKDPYAKLFDVRKAVEHVKRIERVQVASSKMLPGAIGYIRLETFYTKHVTAALRECFSALECASTIILDLRDNRGGYVDAALDLLSMVVTKGKLMEMRGRNGGCPLAKTYSLTDTALTIDMNGSVTDKTRQPYLLNDRALVVLINQGSASASELVAGALQDLRAATIVGSNSFGKFTVQHLHQLPMGTFLDLTYALYYLPSGKIIDQSGVAPDHPVHPALLSDAPLNFAQKLLASKSLTKQ